METQTETNNGTALETVAVKTGRKAYFKGKINWPQKPFTIKNVMNRFNLAQKEEQKTGSIYVNTLARKAVKSGVLQIVGKRDHKGRGRKEIIYSLVVQNPGPEVQPEQ